MSENTSEGGVVLPFQTKSYVLDENDPTRGSITPVMTAEQLTAGVLELTERTEFLKYVTYDLGGHLRDAIAATANMIEYLAIMAVGTEQQPDEEYDEAYEGIKQFLSERAAVRAEEEALVAAQEAQEAQEAEETLLADEREGA